MLSVKIFSGTFSKDASAGFEIQIFLGANDFDASYLWRYLEHNIVSLNTDFIFLFLNLHKLFCHNQRAYFSMRQVCHFFSKSIKIHEIIPLSFCASFLFKL
jgi:hypothetical protein